MLPGLGCGPGGASLDTGGATTDAPGATNTDLASTSSSFVPPATSGGSTSTGAASTSAAETAAAGTGTTDAETTSGPPPDLGGSFWCDTYVQDCPPGQKCTVETLGTWNHKCVPIADDPAQLDEPCTVEDPPGSGLSNCDVGLHCVDDGSDEPGKCFAYCQGIHGDPTCVDGRECFVTADSVWDLCYRLCNPLVADCPVETDVCMPHAGFVPGDLDPFRCWDADLDAAHPGQLDSPCEFATQCDDGLVCLLGTASAACDDVGACCQPVCDIDAPNTCPGQGQQCIPWFPMDGAWPGQENVGVCMLVG